MLVKQIEPLSSKHNPDSIQILDFILNSKVFSFEVLGKKLILNCVEQDKQDILSHINYNCLPILPISSKLNRKLNFVFAIDLHHVFLCFSVSKQYSNLEEKRYLNSPPAPFMWQHKLDGSHKATKLLNFNKNNNDK